MIKKPAGAVCIALMLCVLGDSGCSRPSSTAEQAPADTVESALVVPTVKAARANLVNNIVLTAEFQPFQQVDVMAKVSGYVRSIAVDIGDRVPAGKLLATLEIPEMEDDAVKAAASIDQADSEIATATDELRRAEAAHELAHLSYGRIADVLKREPGLVPRQEVDEAHGRDMVAEAQVAAAGSALRTAQQRVRVARAEQARIKTLHNYTAITAPFAGVVTKRYANTGSMIQAGTSSQTQAMPLVQLSECNLLRLILPVPESAVSRIHPGESVDVRVPSMGKTFPGRVARSAGQVQQATRTMDTEVDVANPSLSLLPGMFAEVDLRIEEHQGVVAIPLDAVDRSGSGVRAFTVVPPGVIHIMPITLGLESAQLVEVRSGLNEGDVVVVGRHAGIKEGQPAQARTTGAQVH